MAENVPPLSENLQSYNNTWRRGQEPNWNFMQNHVEFVAIIYMIQKLLMKMNWFFDSVTLGARFSLEWDFPNSTFPPAWLWIRHRFAKTQPNHTHRHTSKMIILSPLAADSPAKQSSKLATKIVSSRLHSVRAQPHINKETANDS